METPTTGVEKTSRSNYESIDQLIAKMKLAFGNASLPQIATPMATVGYTPKKITDLNTRLAQLEVLCQAQTKEYAEQYAEQSKFDNKREDISNTFNKHRALLRILFKGNVQAWVALQLDGSTPKAYPAWTQLLTNFYAQLASSPDLQAKADSVGVNAASVKAQKQALADLQALKDNLRRETAEAQAATDARDTLFDEIYPQYTQYIQYAKVLLADNQALEAIGVTVKAK